MRLTNFYRLTQFGPILHPPHSSCCSTFKRNATRRPTNILPGRLPVYCSADEAVGHIQSGHSIFIHSAAATPTALLKALSKNILERNLSGIRAYHMHMEGESIITAPPMKGRIRSTSLFTGANCRQAIHDGYADFLPVFLSNIPRNFRNSNIMLNFALLQVSPPDHHGFVTLGTSVDCALSACEKADVIIALINERMPRVFGDGIMHISNIDYAVREDQNLFYSHESAPSPEEIHIGSLIANNLIEDGSTLQMGIGSIPNAVMAQIASHRSLGIHTEMASDNLVDLVEKGVVDNSRKVIHPGRSVSSFAVGSQRLYDFLHDNPSFLMLDVSFTNDPSVIRQNPKVVAINSCIEVDLTGQVVSDSIGPRILSGVGGQVDFLTGAIFSQDGKGKPILAMQSRTKRNEPKIVPFVKTGSGITTSRSHVHYIVTEYGIAYLEGKSTRQRAYHLINVAHPGDREALEKAAFSILKCRPSAD